MIRRRGMSKIMYMKSKKNQYKKKSSKKMVTRYIQLPPGDLIGIAELIITGFKILQMIKAGGVEVDPDPEEKEIDNIETIDAEIISSQIKKW